MTPEEVLTAVTLNAAGHQQVRKHWQPGSGKTGRYSYLGGPDLDFIAYHFGVNLVKTVVKGKNSSCR